MTHAHIGDWVEISSVLLKPEERAKNIPPETAGHPLVMRTRGFALGEAACGDTIPVRTVTGRTLRGTLIEVNPAFRHDFGECVPELIHVRLRLKEEAGKDALTLSDKREGVV